MIIHQHFNLHLVYFYQKIGHSKKKGVLMALQKKEEWENNLIDNIKSLNEHKGKVVYLLVYDHRIVGSTKIVNINKYMAKEDLLDEYESEPSEVTLLHALVLNNKELPEKLPDELPNEYGLFYLGSELGTSIEIEEAATIEELIDSIEFIISENPHVDIDDVAVIVGKPVGFILQSLVPTNTLTHSHKKIFEVG